MDKLQHFPGCGCKEFITHPSQARTGIHVFPDRLYVVTMLENPLRWRNRYANYHTFESMVERSGAILYTAEVAFGDRHFEVTEPENPRHLQLRAYSELWRKENALNLAIQRLPADAKYIAWIDADVQFQRPDWAQETLHLLQHYDVLQMFSHAQNLSPDYEPRMTSEGFITKWLRERTVPHNADYLTEPTFRTSVTQYPYGYSAYGVWGHPGFAWAARKDALNKLGGLIDWAILGSGDYHMACALVGQVRRSLFDGFSPAYWRWCQQWEDRATQYIRKNVGFLPGLVTHCWHGNTKNRAYDKRWKFLALAQYDPELDLKRDHQGLWQLTERSAVLRDGIRQYNRMRNEDGNEE
jgi:hypothetical protein